MRGGGEGTAERPAVAMGPGRCPANGRGAQTGQADARDPMIRWYNAS